MVAPLIGRQIRNSKIDFNMSNTNQFFLLEQHHQIIQVHFLPEICQKRQNWQFSGKSTSKSGDTVKSGNFGHFCNIARWFKFKITINWSKTPKSAIFGGNSHPNLVTLLNLNIKTIFYVKMIYNCNCGCCSGPQTALTV